MKPKLKTMVVVTENKRSRRIRYYFPNDVLMEIFPRLPTRSLVRFTCVSKSWNSLIFSHELSNKHLKYSNNFQYRIMLLSDAGRRLEHFSLHSALNKTTVTVFDTNHVDKFPITTRLCYLSPDQQQLYETHPCNTLIGSCNGLICIAVGTGPCVTGSDTIYLWNPSIQKSKEIPSFDGELGYRHVRSYGFGFDESRDDYKVVAFYFSITNYNDVLVKIYSLKTGEVKKIKNHTGRWLSNINRYSNLTTFANGKIHWFAERMQMEGNWDQDNCCIAYLDLATEEYGEIEKPDYIIGGPDSMMALPGGSLYVYCTSSVNSDGNIVAWLVKPKYGFGEVTWTQAIVSIPVYSSLNFGHRNPLFMLDNGVTVWLCGGNVITFNPNDLSVRPCQLTSHHGPDAGISYIESLVSP